MDTSPHRAWRGFEESDFRKRERGPLTIPAMMVVWKCSFESSVRESSLQLRQKRTFVLVGRGTKVEGIYRLQ
jgi:hypothetical protein